MPELRWDLENWYNKLIAVARTAKRFTPGTFATTERAILNQVLELIDCFAQMNKDLPQIISQKSLVELYRLSPEVLAKLTIYPNIIERLSLGNEDEKALAQRNWRLFKKLLQEEDENPIKAQIKANLDQYVQAPTFLMKLTRITIFPVKIYQYETMGSIYPEEGRPLDKLNKKRIDILRLQHLSNDEELLNSVSKVKEAFYEPAQGSAQSKANQEQAEKALYQYLHKLSAKLSKLLESTESDLHRHHFFSARRLKGQPNTIISLLSDYKNAIQDVLTEIEKKNPQLITQHEENKQTMPS